MSLAPAFRLLASLALLVLAFLVMQEPLRMALGRQWIPGLGTLELPGLSGGTNAAPGFVVQVLSRPSGAEVEIDGVGRGTTPMLGNVQCHDDQKVVIRVHRQGFQPETRRVACREGGRLQARITLRSSSQAGGLASGAENP